MQVCNRLSNAMRITAISRIACGVIAASSLFSSAAMNSTPGGETRNDVFDRLLTKGGLPGARDAALPKPTMADGLDRSGQREAIARIADPNHPIEALERPLVVAPFVLKISGDDEKSATLRRIDLWFIAYGKLDRLADESFWKSARESFSGGEKENRELSTTRIGILSADELKTRGLKDPETEKHLTADMTLFNRVRICATMQAIQTRSADSLVLAAMLDPRFADDEQFPNCWRPISRDDNGRQHIGAAQPYRTAGWYCKATQLHEPAGALFVEYHVLFDEPVGWFNGANLLRSKLPMVVQEGVRKFRRQLEHAAAR
ncbi:MAG TPA: hypothetical protein VGH32_01070 [Pirellulales bacterium]